MLRQGWSTKHIKETATDGSTEKAEAQLRPFQISVKELFAKWHLDFSRLLVLQKSTNIEN